MSSAESGNWGGDDRGPGESRNGWLQRALEKEQEAAQSTAELEPGSLRQKRYQRERDIQKDLPAFEKLESSEEQVSARLRMLVGSRQEDWRGALVPGGLRLLAHEAHVVDLLEMGRTAVESRTVSREDETFSERSRLGVGERFLLLLEVIRYKLGRIALLRVAGIRIAEQRRLRQRIV